MNENSSLRILEYDFIKCLCAIGIITFHFSCHNQYQQFKPLYLYANGSFGGAIVTVFFMVSGALLSVRSLNNGIVCYYKRRAKAIYPAFYLVYFCFFVIKIFQYRTPLYKEGSYYIFTLIGIDGYVDNRFHITYYLVGEWFLGALILCYMIFPLFHYLSKKYEVIAVLIPLVLFGVSLFYPLTNPDSYRTLSSCMLSMVLGASLQKHEWIMKNIWLILFSLVLSLALLFVPLPISDNIPMHVMGFCLFILLYNLGSLVMRYKLLRSSIVFVSKLSYIIFLVQHQIIYAFLGTWHPQSLFKNIILFCCIILATIAVADLFSIVIDRYSHRVSLFLKEYIFKGVTRDEKGTSN